MALLGFAKCILQINLFIDLEGIAFESERKYKWTYPSRTMRIDDFTLIAYTVVDYVLRKVVRLSVRQGK